MSELSTRETGLRLWSDEPSAVDLLAFSAVAEMVIDAILDDNLDPLALGVSGAWGSGKTTVLRLINASLSDNRIAMFPLSWLAGVRNTLSGLQAEMRVGVQGGVRARTSQPETRARLPASPATRRRPS